MPRKPSISYWATRKGGGYFCIIAGERLELALGPDDQPTGPTYRPAQDRFQALLEKKKVEEERRPGDSVREVLDDYLKHISKTKKPGTVEIRLRAFKPFVDWKGIGECAVSSLTHADIYRFLEAMERPRTPKRKKPQPGRKSVRWGPGSQRNFLLGVNAAFNWAVRSGILPKNPLAGIEKPTPASRGAESLIGRTTQEIEHTHARILAAVPASYRPLVQALKDTGARPGELVAATSTDFQSELAAIVFHKDMTRRGDRFAHKTAHRKDRVIFLAGPTLEYVKEAAKTPGPIFRRKSGEGFKKFHVVGRFRKLQKILGLPTLTAYSYRHTFATEMLKAGMDVDTLAELMGNSPIVIRMHYSHLLADAKGLLAKLNRFRTAAGIQTAVPDAGAG